MQWYHINGSLYPIPKSTFVQLQTTVLYCKEAIIPLSKKIPQPFALSCTVRTRVGTAREVDCLGTWGESASTCTCWSWAHYLLIKLGLASTSTSIET